MKKKPFFLTRKFMSIFFAAIMVLSVLGAFSMEPTEKPKEFNGYKFYSLNNAWFTYLNDKRVLFQHLPEELSNISSVSYVTIESPKIYLIQDPTSKNLSVEYPKQILAALMYEKNIGPVDACTEEKNCPSNFPIKNCEELTVPGIVFKYGPVTTIYKKQMCYVIQADSSQNLLKATEKLIYQWLGVIQ